MAEDDFLGRLRVLMPDGWFPPTAGAATETPVLDAVLTGLGTGLARYHQLALYAGEQTRTITATDVWLDLASLDYFGAGALPRPVGASDAAYRAMILAAFFPARATRAAIIAAVEKSFSVTPTIFEPFNTGDSGAYGTGESPTWRGMAYGAAGGWGSLALPAQYFITVPAPNVSQEGIGNIAGWSTKLSDLMAPFVSEPGTKTYVSEPGTKTYLAEGIKSTGYLGMPGGYGVGAIAYIGSNATIVTDAEVYATIAGATAAGVTAWTRIETGVDAT